MSRGITEPYPTGVNEVFFDITRFRRLAMILRLGDTE